MHRTALYALAASGLLSAPSIAAEPIVIDAPEIAAEAPAPYDSRVEFAWGVALTSNYISGGVTQTDDKPAFQAYGEISSGIVYSGVWVSTVDLDPDRWEIDLYWGVRPTFGSLEMDIGYYRYLYDSTGDCCGEWIVKASHPLGERLTVTGKFFWDPQTGGRSASGELSLALTEAIEMSAAFKDNLESHDSTWNAGMKIGFSENLSLDLRYHDSDLYSERYVATLAWDM